MKMPRCFQLVRFKDPSGVSGTGVVAYGVEWPDKTVSLRWQGADPAFANWGSIEAVERVHGHGGLTVVEWID